MLVQYLSEVGECAPDLPMYYYHIPGMTGVSCESILSSGEDRMTFFSFSCVHFSHGYIMCVHKST